MKPRVLRDLFSSRSVVSLLGAAVTLSVANAASLTWDGNGVTAPNPNGGAGTWDVNTTGNWWNGSTSVVWPALGGTDDDAVFANAAGTVSLAAGGVTVNDLTFNTTGYILSGAGTVVLNGTTPTITTASGVTATIGNGTATVLGGSAGLVKAGPGTLVLKSSAANTFTGGVTVAAGTLLLDAAGAIGSNSITLGTSGGAANPKLTLFAGVPGGTAFGAVNVPTNVTGAALSLEQNSSTVSVTFAGATLGSVLNVNQSNATFPNWSQISWTSKITGNGGGSGNDTLVFNNTSGMQNYFTTNTGVLHDFLGNVHLKAGIIAVQSGNAGGNLVIPDTSMLWIEAGEWRWNTGSSTETIDGLRGAGAMGNPGNILLTINASNASNDGNRIFSGALGNMRGALTLSGPGTQEFSGTGVTFNNATNLNNGTLRLTKTTGWGSAIAFGASNTPLLQLNSAALGDNWTFSRQITGGSSTAKIEKVGSGTLVLSPAASSSFTGHASAAVTVTGGKLYANAAFTTAPAVTVGSGTLLGGTSTVGAVTASTGSTIEGGQAGTGALTAGGLTFSGTATVLATPSATAAPLVVTGALTTSGGTGSVVVTPSVIPPVDGTYHLIQFGTFSGAIGDFRFANPARSFTIQQNGNFIDMVVNATSAGFPVWTGGNSGEWSYGTSLGNWKLSTTSAATDFLALDNVLFDDTVGVGSTSVDVSVANISAGIITFNNSAVDYTLGGTMDITTGNLVKTGTGKLTITGAYTFPGGSLISGGTVSVAGETALGIGNRTIDGGTLEYSGATATWTRGTAVNAGGAIVNVTNAASSLSHSGVLSGTGTLTKTGAGTLVLPYTSGTISTPLLINGGTLNLNYGAGAVTYSGGISGSTGILRLDGTGASGTTGLTLTGNNTFTGDTHVYGRRVFLDNPTGNAIGGNIVIKQGNWPYHCITLNRNEQIADTAVLSFEQTNDAYDFRLNGKTETLAGIQSLSSGPNTGFCIIENAGYDGSNDGGIPAGTLKVAGSGNYSYYAGLRDKNGGTNGVLNFEKAGSGTQLLKGAGITYTGTTSVTGGTLILESASSFGSPTVSVSSGAVLALSGTSLASATSVTIQSGSVLDADPLNVNLGTYHCVATQTLTGGGSVDGDLRISGTVQPGDGIGTLAASGILTMNTNSKVNFQVGGTWATTTSDLLTCDIYQIDANSTSPVLVTISTSGLTGFTETQKSIPLIQSTGGGIGFTAGSFIVDAAALNAATGATGTWSVVESGNDLNLVYNPPTGYSAWAISKGLTGPNAAGDADPDHDGIANLIEFVTNSDPSVSSTANLPVAARDGDDLVFTFTRRDDAEYLVPVVEVSESLESGSWTDVTEIDGATVDVVEHGTDPDTVTVTIPTDGATKLFARLKVTAP